MEPCIEVFHADVGVAAYLVEEETLNLFLNLRLLWYLIINLEGFNVGGQRSNRGVRVLTLV